MRHLIGKNVGYLDMKCINCNSYFNFDELYKRRIGEVLKPKPLTNADRIRSMTDEELAVKIEELCQYTLLQIKTYAKPNGREEWLDWLKQEVK